MNSSEIAAVWDKHWRPGYGSINKAEAAFIRNSILRCTPNRYLEIGTASGLSGGLICKFLEMCGGEKFFSIDFSDKFWAEPDKPVGFLVPLIHDAKSPSFSLIPKSTVLDIPNVLGKDKFDGAFIDANHQHPWPTLDTIATLPHLRPGAELIHHDLELFRKQDQAIGIGPKYLFDQIPDKFRVVDLEESPNIFLIRFSGFLFEYQAALADALLLPWTVRNEIPENLLDGYRDVIQRHWGAGLLSAFDLARRRFG